MSKTAIKAMYHYYFSSHIINKIDGSGDTFGLAEDDLVIELYAYSNLIWLKITVFDGCDISDFHSFIADCAAIITDEINNLIEDNKGPDSDMGFFELMDIDEFELDLTRVIHCHTPDLFNI